jgi:predicted aspartyl protease
MGHIARICYNNPQSPNFKGNQRNGTPRYQQGYPNQGLQVNNLQEHSYYEETPHQQSAFQDELPLNNLAFQKQELNVNIPCLTLNTSKLITETIQCGDMIVKTVVDTGAVITVISLKLLACTKFQMTAWEGPRIIMANGSTASLLGATLITVQLHNKIAKGKAVVMQMEGIDLLLGNDFLKQFGKLNIDYQDSQTLITVGELPLNLITPQKPEPGKSVKIQTTEGLNVPAFSVRQVPISQPSSLETQLFTPSRKLMIQKSLTVGHALLSGRVTTVPIANMSCQDVWLDKGTTLGTSQSYTDKIFQCNLEDAGLLPSLTQEVTEAQQKFFDELEKAINSELQEDDKAQLKKMLKNHIICFASNPKDVGRCNVTEHTIQLKEGTQPIKWGPYQSAWKARTIMQTQVNDMLESGLIEISNRAWSFPVVLILKSDGTVHAFLRGLQRP